LIKARDYTNVDDANTIEEAILLNYEHKEKRKCFETLSTK